MTSTDDPEREERLRLLAESLDDVGALHRSVLEEAQELQGLPGEESFKQQALETMPSSRSEPDGRAGGKHLRWILVAAGILLTLGILLWQLPSRGGDSQEPERILGSPLLLLEPVGQVPDYTRFRWRERSPSRGWFVVVVRSTESGAILARSDRLDAPAWNVDEAEQAQWPQKISWEVQPFDASGRPLPPASAQAWR